VGCLGPADREIIAEIPFDAASVRFNDGKIGPDGAFWVGTMDLNARDPIGALYRPAAGCRTTPLSTGNPGSADDSDEPTLRQAGLRIELPAAHVSSCCFGADDPGVLYITTARYGLANPGTLDGALFACDRAGRGSEPYRFLTRILCWRGARV
jgi:sugar lactone lactonase YvrE